MSQLPPISQPECLTTEQLANHRLLQRHGLTVEAYCTITDLALHEKHLGKDSTRHLGWRTSLPLPQIVRRDVTTPGLAAAVAYGFLAAVVDPPYDPVYGGYRESSVVVRLTGKGRTLHQQSEAELDG
ncbi:hypothetical protein [Allokutzneria albata]|uniref:hypothetical protein n=1 Tax=Allokutzneria albata TaxID=211114 RepID=UPI0009F40D4F|nr:hypothetical protein [Allokutzneria albata]